MSALKTLVCFKVTPDFEALREADWAAGAAVPPGAVEPAAVAAPLDMAGAVETRYVPRVFNCFDESALETALRLYDAAPEPDAGPEGASAAEAELVTAAGGGIAPACGAPGGDGARVALAALSIGGPEVDPFLKTLQALGYRPTVRVRADANLDFAPDVVASILAGYVRRVARSDLLLLGCRSGPGDTGTVPFLAAERLGWPCLTQVTEVGRVGADRLRVAYVADDGLARVTVRLPCVLGVGNAVVSRLRVPTLSARLAQRGARIQEVDAADLGVDVAAGLERRTCVLTALEAIDRRRQGIVIGGGAPREKARELFDSHLRERIERL
ncbi:MAG: electron transfer flavoprotein subunit beta/FixA family protein [Thermoleophilia bacterium]